jgi:hypothetical protein
MPEASRDRSLGTLATKRYAIYEGNSAPTVAFGIEGPQVQRDALAFHTDLGFVDPTVWRAFEITDLPLSHIGSMWR